MKKLLLAVAILISVSQMTRAEESSRCLEESDEKNLTDATIKCALPVPGAETESLFSTNASPLDEDTPTSHTEIAGDKTLTQARPWKAPDFGSQNKALGYGENVFAIPKGMERQVQFWVDIYTKYSTDEGVVHDAENIDLVYEVVNFRDIAINGGMTNGAKERLKQKKVDEIKKRYLAMLEKFQHVKSVDELSGDTEKRIWKYFENVNEPDKFKEAMQKGRMRFQLGQKDRMQSAIYFSGRYLEDMEKIFRENNMPVELTRLAFVESSFNVLARSKVGASGLWQIMPYTARPYHYISATVDNRNSPLEATKLAARLLRDNYRLLDSWPLAITGWNHGPTGVRKMTESYKTRNLADLVENVHSRKSFGFASRNFYASFLAALDVEKNANKYFGKVVWSQPLKAQTFKLPVTIKYKELLSWFNNDDDKAQIYNPHLTKQVRKLGRAIPARTTVLVPEEQYNKVLVALAHKDRSVATTAATSTTTSPASTEEKSTTYKVARGDTLIGIAKSFGVKVKDLLTHNELESASKLLPGQILRIPN